MAGAEQPRTGGRLLTLSVYLRMETQSRSSQVFSFVFLFPRGGLRLAPGLPGTCQKPQALPRRCVLGL